MTLQWCRSNVFIVNLEQISHIVMLLPLLTLNKKMSAGLLLLLMRRKHYIASVPFSDEQLHYRFIVNNGAVIEICCVGHLISILNVLQMINGYREQHLNVVSDTLLLFKTRGGQSFLFIFLLLSHYLVHLLYIVDNRNQ